MRLSSAQSGHPELPLTANHPHCLLLLRLAVDILHSRADPVTAKRLRKGASRPGQAVPSARCRQITASSRGALKCKCSATATQTGAQRAWMKKLMDLLMDSRSEVGTMMPSATSWDTTCEAKQ